MKRIKLLLVEDDLADQMSFKRFVKREQLPYDYTVADSIAQAQKISSFITNVICQGLTLMCLLSGALVYLFWEEFQNCLTSGFAEV